METLLTSLILCCLSSRAWSQTATDAKNLKTYLFTTNGYDSKVRPTNNQSVAIQVDVEFYLLSINFLDEVTETLKTTGFLRLYWKDEFLVWNSNHYGGIKTSFWPQDEVWKPDIALKNSYLKYEQLGHKSLSVTNENDGSIMWSPFQVFQSTCSIDITNFPYDQQTCSLKFVAWSYTKDAVDMESGTNGISLAEYENSSTWDITSTTWYVYEEKDEVAIIFELTVRRKPLYNILTLMLPVLMLAILNLFVFVLPNDGGEKAGYAVTVFLAFAVFLTIMESSFPQNSDTVAYFAVYVIMQTVQSTLITLIALLMIRIATFKENTRMPKCVITFIRVATCKPLRANLNEKRIEPSAENHEPKLDEHDVPSKKKEKDIYVDNYKGHENAYTWKCVADTMDKFFFLFFMLTFLLTTILCFLLAQYN